MKITPALGPMSGKLGGIVASHNKGGAYFRRKSIPTNPNTVRQQAIKNIFATLVEAWTETLTQAQREAWDVYAQNVPVTDSLGQTINLSGQNWYIGNNTPRLQAGLPTVANAPVVFNRGNPVTSMATEVLGNPNEIGTLAGNMSTILSINGTAPDDGDMLIYLGAPQNASRNFFKGPYQLAIALSVAAMGDDIAWNTAIAALLNANAVPTVGQYLPIRVIMVYDDGRVSPAFSTIAPVVNDA